MWSVRLYHTVFSKVFHDWKITGVILKMFLQASLSYFIFRHFPCLLYLSSFYQLHKHITTLYFLKSCKKISNEQFQIFKDLSYCYVNYFLWTSTLFPSAPIKQRNNLARLHCKKQKKKHFFFPFFTDCFFNFHCSPFCPSRSFLPCLPLIPLLFQKLSCVREMSIHLNVVQFSEHMQLQGYFLKQIRFKKKKPLSTSCSHSCHLIACSHNPSSYHLFFLLLFS